VIAVLEISNVETAVPTARALVKGGITAIELALRTPAAIPSISEIAKHVPEMLIGIGTVIRPEQIDQILHAGAHFGVAPGFNPSVVKAADEKGFPFAPGISTASELEGAVEIGNNILKLFPAEPLGGVKYLNSMAGPYNYLGLRFIPLGGVSMANIGDWAACEKILAVGGTWIAKRSLIEAGDYDAITRNAAEAMAAWKKGRACV
jgi:2-dehydro-3-deoxyphosphogluconate aldolase/(4S)-4-hydroxy-2-oxoglutarate aldolase